MITLKYKYEKQSDLVVVNKKSDVWINENQKFLINGSSVIDVVYISINPTKINDTFFP
jgi:hypothetical protein